MYTKVVIRMDDLTEVESQSHEYEGEVALCGGGSSGEVDYPDWMEAKHTDWMDDIDTLLQAELSSNSPYYAYLGGYTSSTQWTTIRDRYSTYDGIVPGDGDYLTDWDSIVDTVIAKAQEILPDTTAKEDYIEAQDDRSRNRMLRSANALAGQYAVIGGLNSSAFALGLTLLEVDRQRELFNLDKELTFKESDQRVRFWVVGMQALMQMLYQNIDAQRMSTMTNTDIERSNIIDGRENLELQINTSAQDAKWDFELFKYAGNLLGSIAGTAIPTQNELPTGTKLLQGAAAGAAVGSTIPGVGTAVGAGVGALLSLF